MTTLEQLDGDEWPEPDVRTSLIDTCHRLRKIDIGELEAGDLRILLGQRIGTRHLIEHAIGFLQNDPLVDATFYPGDLLIAALKADDNGYRGFPLIRNQLVAIAMQARTFVARMDQLPTSLTELPQLLDEYAG